MVEKRKPKNKRTNLLSNMTEQDWKEVNKLSKLSREGTLSSLTYEDLYGKQTITEFDESDTEKIEERLDVPKSLEESLKEMKLMREGKLPKRTWEEMVDELRKLEEEN